MTFNLFEKIEELGNKSPWIPYIILIFSILVIFPTLGRSGLANWDEAIYASVAREIYRTGDFLHLKLGGHPYLNKPPLFMALNAMVYHVAGISEFTARFVAGLFGIGNILLGYALIRKLFGKGDALITALLLLSNFHFLGIIRHGRMESMVSFFILLSCYSFIQCRESAKWLLLFFTSLFLGILTKGPTGLIPLFIAIPYFFVDEEVRTNCKITYLLIGLGVLTILSLSWFYLQYEIYGQDYLDKFIGYQIGERIRTPLEGHKGSLLYYFDVIMFKEFSFWAFLTPLTLLFLPYKAVTNKSKDLGFIALYIWIILIIFSLIQSKLDWYVFSLYVPLAYCCTFLMKNFPSRVRLLRELIITVSIVQVLLFNFVTPARNIHLKNMSSVFDVYLSPEDTLTAYHMKFPALYYYADCNVEIINDDEAFKERLNNPDHSFIVPATYFERFTEGKNITVLAKNKYVFFKTLKYTSSDKSLRKK
jgi:4-amino-4-deoxy-L-arabinose transferase-like glycosyltransferase